MRSDTSLLVGDLLGPRPLRIDAARSGKTSPNGRALAKSAFVSFGLSPTSRSSFAPYPAFFLTFFIKFPFVATCGPHADDAHALAAEPREHHDDDAANVDADRDPALGFVVRGQHHGVFEECFVQVGEIQSVLVEIGEALPF